MKRVRVSKLVPKGYAAITLYPFVLVKSKWRAENKVLVNHERIHLRQQKELFIIAFFVWYGVDFLVKFCKHRNWKKAYRNIIFEREAYANEDNLEYLESRKLWSFWKYR